MHWTAISPDLTRNDKAKQVTPGGPIDKDDTGTEYYDTIFAVAESPVAKGQIWAGTDDGLVQLTRDGGKTWSNVTPKELPEWGRVSLIDPSHFEAGTAYLAVNFHQSDDLRPYLYKTNGFRQDLDEDCQRHSRKHVCARDSRRSEAQGPALCRHGNRDLCFVRRWRELAFAAVESAELRRCTIWW